MAGIWEHREQDARDACAIITTGANALMQPVHNRMPAIIRAGDAGAWLGGKGEEHARLLLAPFAAERMTARRVSMYVNNARNEGAACVADAEVDVDATRVERDVRDDESGSDETLPLF